MPDKIQVDKDGTVKPKRTFSKRDQQSVADYVLAEYDRRKESRERKDREKHWKEIDRQIAMEPDIQFKKIPGQGDKVDSKKAWMSEMELPLQAEALEVLTADTQELLFPDSGLPFRAHAETTDTFLETFEGLPSIILGDENDVPSKITQDNVDHLCSGFVAHMLRQTDFEDRVERCNAEAFKYGIGIGRARMETKSVFIHEARGVRKETQNLPVLVPTSVKNTYLDEPGPSTHSSQVMGEAHISEDFMALENLHIAASKGSKDPSNMNGGWIPANLKGIEPGEHGRIQLLEMEGDFIVPRKTSRSFVLRGYIATVVVGKDSQDKVKSGLVRLRKRKYPFSSYILFPYHYEGAYDVYPSSPLQKGRTVQIMAVEVLNRLLDSAALKNSPPVSYDGSDPGLMGTGGPVVAPYELWQSLGEIKAHTEVGGEPAQLSEALSLALRMYAELTGVLPTRVGSQTVSHTTAFAKEAELQRGASRTVAYVDRVGKTAMVRWLDMAYRMGRDVIGRSPVSFYIDSYGGFVSPTKDHLPENVMFKWFGAGGPAEKQALARQRMESMQSALQLHVMAKQMGEPSEFNIQNAIRETLREGKWTDVDAIAGDGASSGSDAGAQGVQGAVEGDPGVLSTAIQANTFGQ